MDDSNWAWPAWKFGMKRDDLFTTLHDKYNTFSVSLCDPEAFHHDVYELSTEAATADEFHRLMAGRQQQRVRELNESLESLAVEIIANPDLIGTEQWQHCLQLFRTKSYDSIVRYFASYLPADYLDNAGKRDTIYPLTSVSEKVSCSDSNSCTFSNKQSVDDDTLAYLDDDDFHPHGPVMAVHHNNTDIQGPLSPPHSETTHSETSDSLSYSSTRPPSRSMSFSGSESGRFELRDLGKDDFDTISQSDAGETVASSVFESVETASSVGSTDGDVHDKATPHTVYSEDDYDEFPPTQFPEDEFDMQDGHSWNTYNDTPESDTPTPRHVSGMTSYMDSKAVSAKCLAAATKRSPSPISHIRLRALGVSASTKASRRSPEEAHSKVQKPPADMTRRRPKGIRALD